MRFLKKLLIAAGTSAMLATAAHAATASISPGLNLLTGTTKPETFDSYSNVPSNITGGVLADSPFSNEEGKVLFYNKQNKYGSFHFVFNDALPKERAYQVSFKIYQQADADNGYGKTNGPLWVMKNSTSAWQVVKEIKGGLIANNADGWTEYSYLINNFDKLTNTKVTPNELDTTDISKIIIQWEVDSAESQGVYQKVYVDDVSIVPAYLITYLDDDGNVYKTEYANLEGSSFVPTVTAADRENNIIGWSAKNDGTADKEITLNNKDFTLYAVYSNAIRIKLSSDVTLIDAKDGKTTITASVSNVRNSSTMFRWAVAEGGDFVTLTDNGDGTATISSKAEGMSKITYTASSGESAEIYILSKYLEIPNIEVTYKVADLSKFYFDGNHKTSYYDSDEGAYKFINTSDVVKSDDGNGNVVYYTDGFMRFNGFSVDTSVYKYLLVTLKQDVGHRYQIRYECDAWYTVSQGYPYFAATNGEYVTYVFDMYTGTGGKTFKNFVLGILGTGEAYIKDVRFSNLATSEPETPETRVIKVIKKPTGITTESGKASMKAAVFKNKKSLSASSPVWSVSDTDKAIISYSNGGATAELSALANGKVTVTVSDSADESVYESFEVEISGQREKHAVYEIRVLFWGASVTKHAPNEALAWTGNWGMAASSEDKDYVHRTVAKLEEEFYPAKVSYKILANASSFDRDISADTDSSKDYSSDSRLLELKSELKDFKPNIVHVENMGNIKSTCLEDCLFNAYSQAFDMIYEQNPDMIIYSGACHLSHNANIERVHERLEEYFEEKDKAFIPVHYQLVGHSEYFATEYLKLDPPQTGVAGHWNDAGMEEVAKISVNKLSPAIRSVFTPKYVYLPESLTISGDNKITSNSGQTQFSVSVFPSDASADVIWSVDNEKIAKISEDGVLTALNNGTVNVTATSLYDSTVTKTVSVTVSGQPNAYTVTYNANTADTVTGLPENEVLVRGTVTLSDKRPLRDCYTFAGWSKSSSSSECITTLNVEENTTVYAVWEKTTAFDFDGTYDENFAYTYGFDVKGGFHAEIEDGHITAICTGGEKVRFVSPKIDIANKGVVSFSLESAYAESGDVIELTVKTADSSKTYRFPLTGTDKTTYIADTSSLSGNITGVEIYVNAAPADGSMFGISIDYIHFDALKTIDASISPFSMSDGSSYISSAGGSETAVITADNAESEDLTVVFDGGFGVKLENPTAAFKLYVTAAEAGANVTVTKISYAENGSYLPATAKVYTAVGSSVSENPTVSGVLTSYDRSSIRTADPRGIRVMASVTAMLHTQSGVAEYGYLVTRNDYMEKGVISDLIYNSAAVTAKKILVGVAFNKEDNTHIFYDVDTEKEIFTCVLTHVPMDKASLETKLVFRSYIKLDDGNYVYGVKTTKSLYETAKSIVANKTADTDSEVLKAAEEILDICDVENEKEIRINADELYTLS